MNRFQPHLAACIFLAPLSALGVLNDTGMSACSNGTTLVTCDQLIAGDDGPYPRQDGRFGRDAQVLAGTLPVKTGGGMAGFDFTRICRSGELEGEGSCPENPTTGDGNGGDDWGCTRDNVTGLVWEVKTSDNESETLVWDDAADYAASLDLCGLSDWRLPTRRELYSIANLGRVSPALDTTYFPNHTSQTATFWALEASTGEIEGRWGVSAAGGSSFPSPAGPVVNTLLRVRAVSGAGIDVGDYLSQGATVTDGDTGLIWDRCPWGMTWDDATPPGTCAGTPSPMVGWDSALQVSAQANQAEHLGHSDWRVPNARTRNAGGPWRVERPLH